MTVIGRLLSKTAKHKKKEHIKMGLKMEYGNLLKKMAHRIL